MMTNEGDRGVAASTTKPIEKLHETNSFMYTHLHSTTNAGDSISISSGTPRYNLRNYRAQETPSTIPQNILLQQPPILNFCDDPSKNKIVVMRQNSFSTHNVAPIIQK